MKNLKDIINEYNNEISFPFLGNTLVVSKERSINNQIRIKYNAIADKAKKTFAERIAVYNDAKALIDGVAKDFLIAMTEGIDELTKDSISVECYTLDMDAVVKLCMKKGYFNTYDKAVKTYRTTYVSILQNHLNSAQNAYSNAANGPELEISNEGRTIGESISNQLQADFANSVINELRNYAAAEEVSRIEEQCDRAVAQFFNTPQYKNDIINSVWNCAANLRLVITNYLNDEKNLGLGGWVTNDDSKNAESIYNNLKNIQLSEDDEKKFAFNILQLNPYNYNYYKLFLNKFLNNSREIIAISEYFNVNIKTVLREVIENYAKKTSVIILKM